MYLQIMWKFLEQRSFHLSESEYAQQLDAVAEYLTLWRVAPNVRAGIKSATPRGPGYTGGGGARAVSALCHISSLHALRHRLALESALRALVVYWTEPTNVSA